MRAQGRSKAHDGRLHARAEASRPIEGGRAPVAWCNGARELRSTAGLDPLHHPPALAVRRKELPLRGAAHPAASKRQRKDEAHRRVAGRGVRRQRTVMPMPTRRRPPLLPLEAELLSSA